MDTSKCTSPVFPSRQYCWQERRMLTSSSHVFREEIPKFKSRLLYWKDRHELSNQCSSVKVPRFKSRFQYWKERHELSIQLKTASPADEQIVYTKEFFEEERLYFIEASNKCPQCTSKDNFEIVLDTDQYIHGKNCKKCNYFIGADDTVSIYSLMQLRKIIGRVETTLCDCGNKDIFQYSCYSDNLLLCNKCSQIISVYHILQEECNFDDSDDDACERTGSNNSDFVTDLSISCNCGNNNNKKFSVQNGENGNIKYLHCNECCNILSISPNEAVSETQIENVSQLKSGQHIKFRRPGGHGWEHHLIVESVNIKENIISVIQLAPLEGSRLIELKSKAIVHRKDIKLDAKTPDTSGILYRVEYAKNISSPSEVLKRAYDMCDMYAKNPREYFKRFKYNLLSRNCECFASYCVTGEKGPGVQVQQFVDWLKWTGAYIGTNTTEDIIQSLVKVMLRFVTKASVSSVDDAIGFGLSSLKVFGLNMLGLGIGVVLNILIEVVSTIKDINANNKKIDKMLHVTEEEKNKRKRSFKKDRIISAISKILFSNSFAIGGSLLGIAVGTGVGGLILPVVGGLVGAIVGCVIGSLVGRLVNYLRKKTN